MPLKRAYEKETDIPESLKSEYEKGEDGTWYLKLEDEKNEIRKFREEGTQKLREKDRIIEAMTLKYKDVDPEAYRKHIEEKKRLEQERAIAEGKAQELLAKQAQEHEQRLKDADLKHQEDISKYKSKYHQKLINSWLADKAETHGKLRTGNLPLMALDAINHLSVDDNDQVVLKTEKRNAKGFVMTPEEWLADAAKTSYAGLYEPSAGSGAIGNIARNYSREKTIPRESTMNISADLLEAIATDKVKVV